MTGNGPYRRGGAILRSGQVSRRRFIGALGGSLALGAGLARAGTFGSGPFGAGPYASADGPALLSSPLILPSGDRTGVTDTANLQEAASRGGAYRLSPRGIYWLKSRVRWANRVNSGLVCPEGWANMVMLTGPGQFDQASNSQADIWAANHVAFDFSWCESPIMDGIRITMVDPADGSPRSCIPFAVRGCRDLRIGRLEYFGFKETLAGMFSVSTCTGGFVGPLYAHDCNPNSDAYWFQLTAVEIDNFRLNGQNSTGITFQVRYKNLLLGPDAMRAFGPQSDAVNNQAIGYSGHTFDISGDGVGEGLDNWGDGNTVRLNARNTQLFPIKLINGSSDNNINAEVNGTGLAAVYRGPAAVPNGRNLIELNAARVGALHDAVAAAWQPTLTVQPGVYYDTGAPGAIYPTGDRITGRLSLADGLNSVIYGGAGLGVGVNTIDLTS